ncbi:hypothetical protein QAD02_010997 [Eretmocerus hayati]|uniref:Uncharacterized protein n=1 Tax=Eretmocerus hayati TaxID=131215 RepID=A0ACC2NWL8_9HYME|nr:hypothetical protein QAD02_010997 [Eretmocerus hayati]
MSIPFACISLLLFFADVSQSLLLPKNDTEILNQNSPTGLKNVGVVKHINGNDVNGRPTNRPLIPKVELKKLQKPSVCLTNNGQYPNPADCAKYFKCWNGNGVEQFCPDELLFNDRSLLCDLPKNVQCGNRPSITRKDSNTILGKNKAVSDKSYDYGRIDEDWAKKYPSCGGTRQSPVNIDLQNLNAFKSGLPPIRHNGYDSMPKRMSIINNGYTVQLTGEWQERDKPTISGGPLNGSYEFAQLHFHWSMNNSMGSEHSFNNKIFPLEMHMVHWKKSYGNMSAATKYVDGIVVIGYLMPIRKNSNHGMENMQTGFPKILAPGQSTEISPFSLALFDQNLAQQGNIQYIIYTGSLTTPPCSESAIWLLSAKTKSITADEMELFRRVQLSNQKSRNHRPTQPLNGRPIFYTS